MSRVCAIPACAGMTASLLNSLGLNKEGRKRADPPRWLARTRPLGDTPPMLYKFKSKATGDLIMLEPNGRRVLQIIGKDPAPKGILLAADMPAAIRALEAAIEREEADQRAAAEAARAEGREVRTGGEESVSLRQRAKPFIDMLRRCQAAGQDIVWGV